MQQQSSEFRGFCVLFQTAGKHGGDLHSFLADRVSNGTGVDQQIRDVLNDAASNISNIIAKERAVVDAEDTIGTLLREG